MRINACSGRDTFVDRKSDEIDGGVIYKRVKDTKNAKKLFKGEAVIKSPLNPNNK